MKRLFGSVRAQATIGATLVVAVALIAAGTAVLLSLRSNLIQEAAAQADATARQVASKVAARTAYEDLDL
ncbi:hypothetical protein ADL27_48110, partial [Streptomyces sp. NRRL F-6602]